ncbi:MAG: DNA primase [Gammaproteobacteria bacterium]|nr:DNA primase [Gammaproteobacteria bacterium]
MAGKIPAQFIDDLIDRVDIVDLINGRVQLKKTGRDYQACCPFHDEKTPSFTVSREKQFYHCFGCGAHGTAVGFLMEYDNMGFVDAIEELAQQQGLEVPREGGHSSGPDLRPLYETLEHTTSFYGQQLRKHPQAQQAVAYLKERGLSGEIAAEFGVGYAPPGWDNLINQLGSDKEGLERLRVTGMISEPDGKCYDRFRNRIMFPIRDRRGRVIAFGGRVLGDDKPKYLNSPETPIFHKGRELYGLYEAHQALRKIQQLLVVEGYMDVVALAQFGIRYAVATLGTATTNEHMEQLFRVTHKVIFCYDGDRAGREAGWKALKTTLPLMRDGREARFLFLPDGEDPDTLIRKEGTEAFTQRIDNATPLSQFMFDRLSEEVDTSEPGGRARLAELAKPLISTLPKGVFRDILQQQLNAIVGLDTSHIMGTTEQTQTRKRQINPHSSHKPMPLVRRAITILLQHPQLALLQGLPEKWRELDSTGTNLLGKLLELVQNHPNLKSAQLIERWRGTDEYPHLNKLSATDLLLPEQGIEGEFRDTLIAIEQQIRTDELNQLLEKAKTATLQDQEKNRLNQLLRENISQK